MVIRLAVIWSIAIFLIVLINHGLPHPSTLLPLRDAPRDYQPAALAALFIWAIGLIRLLANKE